MKIISFKSGAAKALRLPSSSLIGAAVAMAIALPGVSVAEVEIYGYVKNETAVLTGNGQFIGEATSTLDSTANHDEFFKFETSARIFVNGDIGENASWHAELAPVYDAQAIKSSEVDYRGHESFTQQDWLRELYVDTSVGNVDLRIGKQQVVWGTADGIKLLDIINPTDFREINQNTTEDARIPIWMATAEVEVGDAGNLQFVLSQVEENKIAGLNASGDQGQAFILKGVDTITGKVNGFLNVGPALSRTAASFTNSAEAGGFDTNGDGVGDPNASGLTNFAGLSVDGFANNNQNVNNLGLANQNITAPGLPAPGGSVAISGAALLNGIAQNGINPGNDSNANNSVTNLVTATFNPVNPDTAFEYMPNASFATFNTFSGTAGNAGAGLGGATTSFAGFRAQYAREYPSDSNANLGFRYKANLDNGLNFSVNYFYHYDSNPSVDLSWRDSVTGEKLTTQIATAGDFFNAGAGVPGVDGQPDFADTTVSLTRAQILATKANLGPANTPTTVLLRNSAGQFYGANNPNPIQGVALSANAPVLRFTEKLNRITSIGGSLDYALNAGSVPVVVRVEALYDKGVKVPVVDRLLLALGDLENSLKVEDADIFKYVIGVDVTLLTNMLVSTQFIQFRNLDFVEQNATCTTSTGLTIDCSRYTADPATLSLTNGLNKGEENKEFVSLFFSKPFGPEQQGRWNNITIFEDTGGRWNRFDVEYGLTDSFIITGEWNNYWGDKNSTFGQLKESSNLQIGLKFIFE